MAKRTKWIKITEATMPPPGKPIFGGGRMKSGGWVFGAPLVIADSATFSHLTIDLRLSHYCEVPDWMLKGPSQSDGGVGHE